MTTSETASFWWGVMSATIGGLIGGGIIWTLLKMCS